jgi:deoxycytidine triphosphate deaminase
MILSHQTIHALGAQMIRPFTAGKTVVNGRSAGLSSASYDMTIAHDLVLGVNPAYILQAHIIRFGFKKAKMLRRLLTKNMAHTALAHTAEDLYMPPDLAAQVVDKSTHARMFCSAFNTYVDPGFCGNLTLELVNLGPEPIVLRKGDPIIQLIFTRLDYPTVMPYSGKYQHQTKNAHGPRME